jgi:hypothetical protein
MPLVRRLDAVVSPLSVSKGCVVRLDKPYCVRDGVSYHASSQILRNDEEHSHYAA